MSNAFITATTVQKSRVRIAQRFESSWRLYSSMTSSTFSTSATGTSTTSLGYRNHEAHEEHLLTTDLFTIKQSDSTSSVDDTSTGINQELLRNVMLTQLAFLGFGTTLCANLVGYDTTNTVTAFGLPHRASSLVEALVWVVPSVLVLMAIEQVVKQVNPRPSDRIHFGINNLVVSLLGRRKCTNQQDHNNNSRFETTTSTMTALYPTVLLSTVTAISQETVFRYWVPMLICHVTHSVAAAFGGQALLYGAFHYSPTARAAENRVLMIQQMAQGVVYGALAVWGGLLPAILAHALYDAHTYTTSWHGVNDQIDWATLEPHVSANEHLSEHDAMVWDALQERSQGALTESYHALQRFYYAFDTDRTGYLSLSNVQTAMAYCFWQTDHEPSPAHVEALFATLLRERPINKSTAPTERLSLVEFVRLLVSLRASIKRPSS